MNSSSLFLHLDAVSFQRFFFFLFIWNPPTQILKIYVGFDRINIMSFTIFSANYQQKLSTWTLRTLSLSFGMFWLLILLLTSNSVEASLYFGPFGWFDLWPAIDVVDHVKNWKDCSLLLYFCSKIFKLSLTHWPRVIELLIITDLLFHRYFYNILWRSKFMTFSFYDKISVIGNEYLPEKRVYEDVVLTHVLVGFVEDDVGLLGDCVLLDRSARWVVERMKTENLNSLLLFLNCSKS